MYPFNTTRSVIHHWLAGCVSALLLATIGGAQARDSLPEYVSPDPLISPNPSGWVQTSTASGVIDADNPFFQSLGRNGRSCSSCHQLSQGWSISATEVQRRFNISGGRDPIFRLVDGAVSPRADVSNLAARRNAYAMLTKYGVVRVGLPMPENAEFSLTAVDDPYHFASGAELSLFRRPLPATNLIWDTSVMWDGRFTAAPFQPPMDAGLDREDINASLASQAGDAILGHEEADTLPDAETIKQIVDFERSLFTAQIIDGQAGALNEGGGMGGASILSRQSFWIGINDNFGNDPTGEPFDVRSIRLFEDWDESSQPRRYPLRRARAAIARGEELFNTMGIRITGVAGLNDTTGQPVIFGTCSTCHNAPNIGNHSVDMQLDIGISDASQRTPDLPLYTLTTHGTAQVVQTTDPGLAMLTGRRADIGKFKTPMLRGLAARAPYFHNGSATTLMDVVNFYNTRFNMGMSETQAQDLAAFLSAL